MPFERTVAEDLSLLQAHPDHAVRLHEVIEQSRDYLARWLPWARAQDLAGTRRFLEWTVEKEASSGAPTWLISTGGVIAGVVGSLPIDGANRTATLGYWIGAGHQGRGLVTRGVRAMITDLFEARAEPGRDPRLHREHAELPRRRAARVRPGGSAPGFRDLAGAARGHGALLDAGAGVGGARGRRPVKESRPGERGARPGLHSSFSMLTISSPQRACTLRSISNQPCLV